MMLESVFFVETDPNDWACRLSTGRSRQPADWSPSTVGAVMTGSDWAWLRVLFVEHALCC